MQHHLVFSIRDGVDTGGCCEEEAATQTPKLKGSRPNSFSRSVLLVLPVEWEPITFGIVTERVLYTARSFVSSVDIETSLDEENDLAR